MHVLGTRVPRRLGVARSASSPKAALALGCSLTPGLRISFGRVTCMARAASVPGLWALGFLLLACVCGWVRVAFGGGFCLPLPVVAGVLGGCVWARFVVLSLFCRLFVLFVVGLWCRPAFGTCVVSCAFPLPSAVSGFGVRCGRAGRARVSAVPRPSWLGCRAVLFALFFFFSGCWVSPSRALWSLPPSPFFRAGLLAFFFFFVCLFWCSFSRWAAVPGLVSPVLAGWSPCTCLGVLSSVPSGWGVWPPSVLLAAVWWLWALFARPPPPPFFFGGGGGRLAVPPFAFPLLALALWLVCGVVGPSQLLAEVPVCYSPPLLAGFRCRWWWAVPATPGWGLPAAVVCGGGVFVGLWLVCGVVGPSPLLAEVPVCYSPPLLAGFRCRWWWAVPATPGWGLLAAVVCGGGVLVGLGLVCGVVGPSPLLAEVPVCYSPPLLAGFRCRWWRAVPATPGWGPLAAVVCGVWCVVCGVWCVAVVCWWGCSEVWCGWSLATPGGGSCVLLPATPGWVSLPLVVGGPRHSWLGSACGGGVWCVVCGGGVLVGLWLVCGVVGPSPLLAEVPVCYSPPLLAGFRCRWWWAVPATPGWGSLAASVCGVWRWCVVGVVVGVWRGWSLATPGGGPCVLLPATPGWVSLPVVVGGPRHSWLGSAGGGGVWCVVWCVVCCWGSSPLLAEVPVCYSPPLLAGFRCRWWWAVPATPGWGPLAAVVCVLCLAGSGGPASRARSGAPHPFLWPLCLSALLGPLRAGVAPLSFAAVAVPRWLFFSASRCLARASFVSPAWPLAALWWLLPRPPPPLCLAVFLAPACGLCVFFFLPLLLPPCAPVVSGFLWFPAPGALGLGACVVCFVCLPLLGSPCACPSFVLSAWLLAAPAWLLPPPPPLVSSGFRSCRSVLCAVLCCACLGAVLRRAAACCVARCCAVVCCVALAWCPCLLRRALWRCPSPWGPVLCGAVFCGVPPRCVLCAVCVLSWPGGACCCSPLCLVLCESRGAVVCVPCALRSVRCCASLCWCARVVLFVWCVLLLAPGAVVRCCVLCCFLWCAQVRCWVWWPVVVCWWRVSVSVSLSGHVVCVPVVGVVCCGALLSCVVFCGAVLSRGAVLLCSAVVLRCCWGLLCPPVGRRAVLCCAVGWLCCFQPGGGVCVLRAACFLQLILSFVPL